MNLLRTVSNQLELNVTTQPLQRLTEAPVGPARDALCHQRRQTIELVKESLSKIKDEMRLKSEVIERSESNLLELRLDTFAFCSH